MTLRLRVRFLMVETFAACGITVVVACAGRLLRKEVER